MLHFKLRSLVGALKPLRIMLVPLACAGLVGCPDSDDDEPARPTGGSGGSDQGDGGSGEGGSDSESPGGSGGRSGSGGGGRDTSSGGSAAGSGGSEGGRGGDGGDADADPIERSVGLVLAAPDLPPQFVCLASFEADPEGQPTGEPVKAGGPFGIPDRTDPLGRKLTGGFPYGSVVRLPIRRRDNRFFDGLIPIGFFVDDVSPREFAGSGNDSQTCKRAWAQARDVPARQLRMEELQVGDSWIAGVSGCVDAASSTPECGGAELQVAHAGLDLRPPTSFKGSGDLSFTLQIAHLAAVAPLQDIDVYLQPMRLEGDAKVADGAPILLSEEETALAQGDIVSEAVGVRLASETAKETLLLVAPHGTSPCLTGDTCATIAIPIQPSIDRYASPMAGATGAAWASHQVLALFGRTPTSGEAPAAVVRLGIFDATLP
jgi:hypothetical protein